MLSKQINVNNRKLISFNNPAIIIRVVSILYPKHQRKLNYSLIFALSTIVSQQAENRENSNFVSNWSTRSTFKKKNRVLGEIRNENQPNTFVVKHVGLSEYYRLLLLYRNLPNLAGFQHDLISYFQQILSAKTTKECGKFPIIIKRQNCNL